MAAFALSVNGRFSDVHRGLYMAFLTDGGCRPRDHRVARRQFDGGLKIENGHPETRVEIMQRVGGGIDVPNELPFGGFSVARRRMLVAFRPRHTFRCGRLL